MTERTPIEAAMSIGEAFYVSAEGPLVSRYAMTTRIAADSMAAHLRACGLKIAQVFTSEDVDAAKDSQRNALASAQAAAEKYHQERAERLATPGLKP